MGGHLRLNSSCQKLHRHLVVVRNDGKRERNSSERNQPIMRKEAACELEVVRQARKEFVRKESANHEKGNSMQHTCELEVVRQARKEFVRKESANHEKGNSMQHTCEL